MTEGRAGQTRYRNDAARDDEARAGHAEAARRLNEAVTRNLLLPAVRTDLLAAVAAGATLDDAARRYGATRQRVTALAQLDAEFADALDEAYRTAAAPDTPHGTSTGYRHYRCRCCDCRVAHHGQRSASE